MVNFKQEIAKEIAEVTNLDSKELENYIEIPPNSDLGDYAFPCFKLAKELRKAPPMIANDIKENIKIDEKIIEKIEVVGGYLKLSTPNIPNHKWSRVMILTAILP